MKLMAMTILALTVAGAAGCGGTSTPFPTRDAAADSGGAGGSAGSGGAGGVHADAGAQTDAAAD